ncbi:MAG: RNA-binding protein [Candidatus Beckwithbacteria bacterium]|nr:RNA-binding protein [Patescibacteria group bacterium]
MSFKAYIGNLPYTVTGDQLKDLFAAAGTVVDAIVISDKQSGRSKGFGFVEMSSQEELDKLIEMFNEKDYEGRNMRVSVARPPQPRQDFNRGPAQY